MKGIRGIITDSESLIEFGILVILTIISAILIGKYLQKFIIEKTKSHNVDVTGFIFLKHMIVAIVYFIGFGWALLVLPITNTFAHSLLAGAGASTIILGFASQQLFNNLISGIFLVINRPFKINDMIEVRGSVGTVMEISLNATLIHDENGDKIIIPSSLILNDKIKVITKKPDTPS
jgi:small-conductance mechanosensitive channel